MQTKIPNPSLPTLNRKIAFSTIVQLGGKLIQLILAAVATKLISNFFSADDYGIYGKIAEYSLFFSVVANLGIYGNIVRQMADNPKDSQIFFNGLLLRIITAIFFFVPGILYLLASGSSSVFLSGAILLFTALLFDFITSICTGMLQANYLMGRSTIALIAGRLANLLIIFLLIKRFPAGPETIALIFLSSLIASLITVLLSLYFVRQKISWTWKVDRQFMLKIFKTSLPFGLVSLINLLYFRFLPDYFANHFLDNAQFATFNISFHIAQVASLLSTLLMFSALPGLKEYIDQKLWSKANKLLGYIWKFLFISAVILVVAGSLFGAPMIELLTHKKYFLPEFWFILPMMFALAAISYGYDFILITLFAFEQDWWLVKNELFALLIACLFFIGSYFAPTPTIQIAIVILGAIIGELTMVILGTIKTRKIFAAHPKE